MINIFKYDVVIVRFPFASSLKYKARPAVVVSSDYYNQNGRDTLLILAISSNVTAKQKFEKKLIKYKEAGLLKPSIFKGSIATIEKEFIVTKIGILSKSDQDSLEEMIKTIC